MVKVSCDLNGYTAMKAYLKIRVCQLVCTPTYTDETYASHSPFFRSHSLLVARFLSYPFTSSQNAGE